MLTSGVEIVRNEGFFWTSSWTIAAVIIGLAWLLALVAEARSEKLIARRKVDERGATVVTVENIRLEKSAQALGTASEALGVIGLLILLVGFVIALGSGIKGGVVNDSATREALNTTYGITLSDDSRRTTMVPDATSYLTVDEAMIDGEMFEQVRIVRDAEDMLTVWVPANGSSTRYVEIEPVS